MRPARSPRVELRLPIELTTLLRRLLAPALIEKHEPARRDERLFRLLLPHGDAGVIDGLDAIAGPGVTTLSLGRGNA